MIRLMPVKSTSLNNQDLLVTKQIKSKFLIIHNIARDYIEGIKMLSNMRLCSNVPAQSIVQTALGGHQSVNDYIVPGGRIYEQREYVYKALTDIPVGGIERGMALKP